MGFTLIVKGENDMKSFPNGDMFPALNKHNHILDIFKNAGVPVVLVGGSVRDAILGVESKDIDLATPLTPDVVTERMEAVGYKVYPTGIDHGTVTVMIPWGDDDEIGALDDIPIEITTYRVDACCDGRKADVIFTDRLADDLRRRDFTINAIAYDGETIYDYDGGIADLDDGVIRTVGDAFDRFHEDYLRVIRGYRFASYLRSTFDDIFMLSNETERCTKCVDMHEKVGTVISYERVIEEFNKVFKRADRHGCTQFIKHMYKIGVLTKLLPELDLGPKPCHELAQSPTYHPEGDVLTHIAIAVGCAEGVEGRWIALLHDIAKPTTAAFKVDKDGKQHDYYSFHKHDKIGAEMIRTSVKDRLPLSNDLINKAALCALWHLYIYKTPPSSKSVRKVQAAMGEHLPLLRALGIADHMGRPISDEIDKYFEEQDVPVKPILLGRHLQEDGWEPGPHFGPALKAAFDVQLDEGVTDLARLLEVANGTR